MTAEVDDAAHHISFLDNRVAVNAGIDPEMSVGVLDYDAVEDLVAFLEALTGA